MRRVSQLSWRLLRGSLIVVGLALAWFVYLFVFGPIFGYGEPD